MGLYTDTLLEREKKEKQLVKESNSVLKGEKNSSSIDDKLEALQILLAHVFEKFNIKYEKVHGCKTHFELLECVLDTNQIMYENIDLTSKNWKKSNCYIIAYKEDGTPVLLIPTLFGYFYMLAGDNKPKRYSKKKMNLDKNAFMIFKPLPKKMDSLFGVIKFVFKAMNPASLIWMILIPLLISLVGLLTPWINNWVLHDFLESIDKNYWVFFGMLILFICTGVLSAVLKGFKHRINSTTTIETSATVEKGLMARLLMFPYSYFKTTSASTLNKYLRSITELTTKIINIILGATITFIFSFVYIPQLFTYGSGVAGYALLFLLIQFIVSLLISIITAKNDRYVLEHSNEADGVQYSTLKGIQKVKGVGAERRFYAKWAKSYNRYLNYHLNPPAAVKLNSTIVTLIADVSTVLILSLAFPLKMDAASYIAFNSALAFVSQAVTDLCNVTKDFISLVPLVDYLKPVLKEQENENKQLEYITHLRGNIRLEHVSFSYNENTTGKVVNDFNLSIKAGEKIGVVGESGCGKTTFVKLILGLIEPEKGCIYFDGLPAKTLNAGSLRKHITSVCQYNRLFPGTIFSNLQLSNPEITEKEAWEALDKAAIGDDIRALDLGLDTEISESISCGFSGGQRQRLLLACAFASKNNVLILDEATSALDNQTQDKVLESVYNNKSTVIMVAHRLSTVIDCNRILVFKDGNIVETGTYKELMKNDGYFAELMRKQQLKEVEDK